MSGQRIAELGEQALAERLPRIRGADPPDPRRGGCGWLRSNPVLRQIDNRGHNLDAVRTSAARVRCQILVSRRHQPRSLHDPVNLLPKGPTDRRKTVLIVAVEYSVVVITHDWRR